MRRREFIGLIGTIGAVWPRNLVAQPADQLKKKMPRIGFLASVPHERIDAFDRGLREQGYSDGENIIIERRFWKNDPEQLAKFAAELVALDVEVIVAPTTPEALAAKALTSTIPIVTATADAVGVGLAESFARPGGNVTGLTAVGGSIKNLGLLAELLPASITVRDPARPRQPIPFTVDGRLRECRCRTTPRDSAGGEALGR